MPGTRHEPRNGTTCHNMMKPGHLQSKSRLIGITWPGNVSPKTPLSLLSGHAPPLRSQRTSVRPVRHRRVERARPATRRPRGALCPHILSRKAPSTRHALEAPAPRRALPAAGAAAPPSAPCRAATPHRGWAPRQLWGQHGAVARAAAEAFFRPLWGRVHRGCNAAAPPATPRHRS